MKEKIIFISHEATRTGAPILLLHLLKALRPQLEGYELFVVLGKDGPLRIEFAQIATVILAQTEQPTGSRWKNALLRRLGRLPTDYKQTLRRKIDNQNIRLVFSNTIANGRFVQALELPAHVPVLTYTHELKYTIDMQQRTYGDVAYLLERTTYFLAGSNAVRQELLERGISAKQVEVVYSSVPVAELDERVARADTKRARQLLQLTADQPLVLAIGTASWRKGNDWFLMIANYLVQHHPHVHFAWVGVTPESSQYLEMSYDLAKFGLASRCTLIPVTPDYVDYLALADVFVLPSREDPFPLVVLEAALAGKPTVCFAGAGGAPEFVGVTHGKVVPYGDVQAFAEAVASLLAEPAHAQALGAAARADVQGRYDATQAAARIGQVIQRLAKPSA